MRIGSLFSGAAGLDRAVEAVFGGEVAWFAEIDKAASKVLAYHYPNTPNLGDITAVDWADVPPVDVLCGGFPCQDVSAAGKRAGIKDGTRSGLWSVFAEAIDALRPQWVVIENVRGLLSATAHRTVEDDESGGVESSTAALGNGAGRPVLRAAGAVLGDLAERGYDAQWTTLAAASVGAPHRRERVFILATDTRHRNESERAWPAGRQDGQRFSVGGVIGCDSQDVAVSRDGDAAASHPGGAAVGQFTGGSSAAQTGPYSGDRSGDHRGERADVELLPTPAACNPNDGEGAETWLARREVVKARVKNGNGMGMPLSIAVQLLPGAEPVSRDGDVALLPTPTAQDGANNAGPSQFQRNTLPVNAEVMLLPTPNAQDGNGGKAPRGGRDTHNTGTKRQVPLTDLPDLLPTPSLSDNKTPRRGEQLQRTVEDGIHTLNLADAIELTHGRDVALLCTPSASDGAGGKTSRSGGRIDEPLLGGQAREMATAWGKYEPAIRRWEQIVGPTPAPTEPNKNGNPRLSAAFSEWLMGWPVGWVTDPAIEISRNDQLRIVGNGVVSLQAEAALRYLLSVSEVDA